MKLTAISNKTVKEEIVFPCLMKLRNSTLIVLFSEIMSGTVVVAGHNRELGDQAQNWRRADDNEWEPYYGVVTLQMTKE